MTFITNVRVVNETANLGGEFVSWSWGFNWQIITINGGQAYTCFNRISRVYPGTAISTLYDSKKLQY